MNEDISAAREILSLTHTPAVSIHYFPSITSTNTYLKELAARGVSERTVIIAGTQTNGRGRMGRSFYSPDRSGLYMSILLRPQCSPAETAHITPLAAVAVARALEQVFSVKAGIKWVNDLYLEGKKVCGILTEGSTNSQTGLLNYLVVGIGINLTAPREGFPKELEEIAGAVTSQGDIDHARSRTAAAVLDRFFELYERNNSASLLSEYKSRCITLGQDVSILSSGERVCNGRAVDIDSDFALVLRDGKGELRHISSGEVSLRPAGNNL